jgi:hypothetical protein
VGEEEEEEKEKKVEEEQVSPGCREAGTGGGGGEGGGDGGDGGGEGGDDRGGAACRSHLVVEMGKKQEQEVEEEEVWPYSLAFCKMSTIIIVIAFTEDNVMRFYFSWFFMVHSFSVPNRCVT